MKNVFVAVATGQKIANLPPILQYAERGDRVMWLLSPEAKDKMWLEGVLSVLENRGISSQCFDVKDLYSPKEVRDVVLNDISLSECEDNVFFVLNGGPKLTPVGLVFAGRALQKKAKSILYLHGDTKTFFRRYSNIIDESLSSFESDFYDRDKMLTLKEIVEINGKRLGAPKYVWSVGHGDIEADLLDGDSVESFRNALMTRPAQNLGDRFEKAVLRRVVQFFCLPKNRKYKAIVKEVVWHAGLFKNDPETDFDVAIVLLNGIVLHLECKSGTLLRKDLQSRILVLEKATSRIARLYVVVPFFPDLDSELFERQYKRRKELADADNVNELLFTDENEERKMFRSPTGREEEMPQLFESAFSGILDDFLPH